MERIEPFTEKHLGDGARVLAAAFNAEPWNENWTLATARKSLSQSLGVPGYVGFASLKEEEILGLAVGCREQDGEREVFYLEILCVRPDAQGAGIGGRLLEHLKNEVERADIHEIYLITHKGTPAESLYRKNGYRVSDEDVVMIHEW